MSEALATTDSTEAEADSQNLATHPGENLEDYVTFRVEGQLFGIPVLRVQDILKPERIAPVPLAPKEVKGSINLRGRIVTVIDVRIRLGLAPRDDNYESMGVTVEQDNDLYTLMVDEIGDVIELSRDCYERNPGTLDSLWREFTSGVFRLDKELMVVLDIDRLLDLNKDRTPA
ncbi:MAG: chemotaxis protein CheW [Proteobacteria bacterium]|nr:chemotaxis protein CheW [Pseudomonadota bacterium]